MNIIDTEQEWTVEPEKFYTRGTHSPFAGRKLKGRAVLTMVDGRILYENGAYLTLDAERIKAEARRRLPTLYG